MQASTPAADVLVLVLGPRTVLRHSGTKERPTLCLGFDGKLRLQTHFFLFFFFLRKSNWPTPLSCLLLMALMVWFGIEHWGDPLGSALSAQRGLGTVMNSTQSPSRVGFRIFSFPRSGALEPLSACSRLPCFTSYTILTPVAPPEVYQHPPTSCLNFYTPFTRLSTQKLFTTRVYSTLPNHLAPPIRLCSLTKPSSLSR